MVNPLDPRYEPLQIHLIFTRSLIAVPIFVSIHYHLDTNSPKSHRPPLVGRYYFVCAIIYGGVNPAATAAAVATNTHTQHRVFLPRSLIARQSHFVVVAAHARAFCARTVVLGVVRRAPSTHRIRVPHVNSTGFTVTHIASLLRSTAADVVHEIWISFILFALPSSQRSCPLSERFLGLMTYYFRQGRCNWSLQ